MSIKDMDTHLTELTPLPPAKIAILGGTFINDYLFATDHLKGYSIVDTPAGPSPKIYYGESDGIPFYYVHFHGEGKWLETWLALRDLGVTEAIGGATAGGISPLLKTRDYVIPKDFTDKNIDRISNIPEEFLADPSHALCRFTPPYDETLRSFLVEETRTVIRSNEELADINVMDGGVLLQSRFGRFETVAEIAAYRTSGADLITHNLMTEVVFAKQLGIHYAWMNIISNPAEGVAPWAFESLSDVYLKLNPVTWKILKRVIPRIAEIPEDAPRTIDKQREHPPLSYVELSKKAGNAN
jgi:5'-methylthioadenosine phosphorylase